MTDAILWAFLIGAIAGGIFASAVIWVALDALKAIGGNRR